jgi:RNA polymerase sigma-70 factor (TIGR02960 family)
VDLRFGSGAWLVTQAAHGDEEAFRQLTAPYRRELQLHCYRMLGSMHDAEDALQETMLGAWRGLERFERRASVRAWLYRIATNRCLDALRDAGRRPRPSQAPAFQPPSPTRFAELTWIKPYPDVLLEGLIDTAPGPAARYQTRETIELAFITALQALPPRQRAVLVLRDVLGYHATEVADMLDSSEDAVKSALKRARVTLDQHHAGRDRDRPPAAGSPSERAIVQRFADAWEADDIAGSWRCSPRTHGSRSRPRHSSIKASRRSARSLPHSPRGAALSNCGRTRPREHPTRVRRLRQRPAISDRARQRPARRNARG